jgi:hypothetical protein
VSAVFNASGSLSCGTLTGRGRPAGVGRLGAVKARGCQSGIDTPRIGLAALPRVSGAPGEGGLARAIENVRTRRPEMAGTHDAMADRRVASVLGISQRPCTEITARRCR